MIKISKYFQKDSEPRISRTFPYKLFDAFSRLKDKDGKFRSTTAKIFEIETKRLLLRSLEGGKVEERKKITEEVSEILSNLFWSSGIGANVDSFINLLEISKFISTLEE